MFTDWLKLNEHIWLFWQLNIEIFLGATSAILCLFMLGHERASAEWLKREYEYDEQKDIEKKQRKTKTTKKTTTQPGGASITEEQTEVTEPMQETK